MHVGPDQIDVQVERGGTSAISINPVVASRLIAKADGRLKGMAGGQWRDEAPGLGRRSEGSSG